MIFLVGAAKFFLCDILVDDDRLRRVLGDSEKEESEFVAPVFMLFFYFIIDLHKTYIC
jgi:hypothetical protein